MAQDSKRLNLPPVHLGQPDQELFPPQECGPDALFVPPTYWEPQIDELPYHHAQNFFESLCLMADLVRDWEENPGFHGTIEEDYHTAIWCLKHHHYLLSVLDLNYHCEYAHDLAFVHYCLMQN